MGKYKLVNKQLCDSFENVFATFFKTSQQENNVKNTVKALLTNTLISQQLYLWPPWQNSSFVF